MNVHSFLTHRWMDRIVIFILGIHGLEGCSGYGEKEKNFCFYWELNLNHPSCSYSLYWPNYSGSLCWL